MSKPLRDNPPDASNVAAKTIEIKAPCAQIIDSLKQIGFVRR